MIIGRGTFATFAAVVLTGIGATGCGTQEASSPPAPPPTNADRLSAIDDSGSASDFQQLFDCLTATGAPGTETEQEVADTMVASWNESSKRDSLYDFSEALASFYNC